MYTNSNNNNNIIIECGRVCVREKGEPSRPFEVIVTMSCSFTKFPVFFPPIESDPSEQRKSIPTPCPDETEKDEEKALHCV